MFDRMFAEMKESDLEEMASSLLDGTVTREDYRRLCRWLIAGIGQLDSEPDKTLLLLEELTGSVSYTQRMLLRTAYSVWRVVPETFLLIEPDHHMWNQLLLSKQMTLPF